MSSAWPDDLGRDARVEAPAEEAAEWLWCRGVRFRVPTWFDGLRICSPPTDVERKITGRMAYEDELVLRSGPWYHPGIAADAAFLKHYVDVLGFLPGRRGYTLAAVATWEWRERVLRWPSDILCPTWSVTSVLARREGRLVTMAERHALYVRIIGVRRTRFGGDFTVPGRPEDSAAEDGWSTWYYRTRGERAYCGRLAPLLSKPELAGRDYAPESLCLGVRVPREWRYLPFDRESADGMSGFLAEVRWAWRRMNENGVFVDYHNKEFDYLLGPVRQRVYVKIPSAFRDEYCPPNGFWPCLPLVLTYRTEVFMAGVAPWSTVEGTVFRTEYAALYAVAWLREVYGRYRMWYMPLGVRAALTGCKEVLTTVLGNEFNVEDLFSLMAVEATVRWPEVAEVNRAGKRPPPGKDLACSRRGPGGDYENFNPWTGEFLSPEGWLLAVQSEFPRLPAGFPLSDLWNYTFPEDSFSSRGHAAVWRGGAVARGWDIVPPPPLPVGIQTPPVFAIPSVQPRLRSVPVGRLPAARDATGRVAVDNEVVELDPLPIVSACGEGSVHANMASASTSGGSRVQTRAMRRRMTATAALAGQVPSRTSDMAADSEERVLPGGTGLSTTVTDSVELDFVDVERRAIAEAMRLTADKPRVVQPAVVAIESAPTAEEGDPAPGSEVDRSAAIVNLNAVPVAVPGAGARVSKGTRRLAQHLRSSEPVTPVGPVLRDASVLPVGLSSPPTLADARESPVIVPDAAEAVAPSAPAVEVSAAGQADEADVLEWHGIRLRPDVVDSVEAVKYLVRRSTRQEVFAISAFVEAWKKTFDT